MKLEHAKKLAEEFVAKIAPFCEKVRIVGSIRRCKSQVKDIDLIMIVRDWWNFTLKLRQISKVKIDGEQVKRVVYKGEQIDLYLAEPETWEALILIRTGSAEHNIKLSKKALSMGMQLSHRGLVKDGKIIASRTEEEILEALGLEYVPPEEG